MSDKLWEGGSDIFTDYEGTVTDAKFENSQYGTQMKLTFDEIDGREKGVFEYYSIPETWTSEDGGETISRLDGKSAKENPLKRSNAWQRFVMAAAACGNGIREAVGDEAPLTASAWIGCRFRMEAVKGKEYTDRDTKEKKKAKDKNFPVEFLGKDSQVTSSGAGSTSGGNGQLDSLSVLTDLHNPVVESQISELAKTLPYPAWFQQSYAKVTEAGIDPATIPDLVAAMSQRKLYESLGGKG